jgi:hypothetical protein
MALTLLISLVGLGLTSMLMELLNVLLGPRLAAMMRG